MSAAKLCSIAPVLPLHQDPTSTCLVWESHLENALKILASGPDVSLITSGQALDDYIVQMRKYLGEGEPDSPKELAGGLGLRRLFDYILPKQDVSHFFISTLPCIAMVALQLPDLLEQHVEKFGGPSEPAVGNMILRVLPAQSPGIVMLHQSLVASLLACAFLCLYRTHESKQNKTVASPINFNGLYRGVIYRTKSQVQKMKCLIQYFEKVVIEMPEGCVSFERKVLPIQRTGLPNRQLLVQNDGYWSNSKSPLCKFKVMEPGIIEDAGPDYLQVDFANKNLGGGALRMGCAQEEIRFMICPELIAGMLFMPTMASNESIEIIGAQRYSDYKGYTKSFCCTGDYKDDTPRDLWGRRKTCIVAIDALSRVGEKQFEPEGMLRDLTKAFCGFLNPSLLRSHGGACCQKESGDNSVSGECQALGASAESKLSEGFKRVAISKREGGDTGSDHGESSSKSSDTHTPSNHDLPALFTEMCMFYPDLLGIATGNWGCGAFGGDVELKSILQWLAASQAGSPLVLYYSFGDTRAAKLTEVVDWLLEEQMGVADLWSKVMEYGKCRVTQLVCCGLHEWLLQQRDSRLPPSHAVKKRISA